MAELEISVQVSVDSFLSHSLVLFCMSFVVSTILDGLLVLVLLLLLPATFFCMCQIFILVYILKWSVCIKANERMVAYSILLGSARATPKSNLVYELKIRYLCCFSLVLTCFLFSLLHHRCLLISFAPIMFLVRVFLRYMMGAYVDVFVCDVYIYISGGASDGSMEPFLLVFTNHVCVCVFFALFHSYTVWLVMCVAIHIQRIAFIEQV